MHTCPPAILRAVHENDPGDVHGSLTQSWDGVVGRCCIFHLQFAGLVKYAFSNLDAFKDRVDQMVIGSVQIELVTLMMIAICSQKESVI